MKVIIEKYGRYLIEVVGTYKATSNDKGHVKQFAITINGEINEASIMKLIPTVPPETFPSFMHSNIHQEKVVHSVRLCVLVDSNPNDIISTDGPISVQFFHVSREV